MLVYRVHLSRIINKTIECCARITLSIHFFAETRSIMIQENGAVDRPESRRCPQLNTFISPVGLRYIMIEYNTCSIRGRPKSSIPPMVCPEYTPVMTVPPFGLRRRQPP